MQRLTWFAFLSALVSLSIAGGCKSDDAGGAQNPQQPGTAVAPAPDETAGAPGMAEGGDDGRQVRRGWKNMSQDERRAVRREERLRKFDTNKDGRLNKDERAAMRTALVDMRMQRIDSDGDGRITRQEASNGRIGQRLLADFDRADANRDASISRQELEAAIDAMRAQRRAEREQAGGAAAAPRGTAPSAPAAPPVEEDDDSLDDE